MKEVGSAQVALSCTSRLAVELGRVNLVGIERRAAELDLLIVSERPVKRST